MKIIATGNNPHVVSLVGAVTIQEPIALLTLVVKYGDLLSYLKYFQMLVRLAIIFGRVSRCLKIMNVI